MKKALVLLDLNPMEIRKQQFLFLGWGKHIPISQLQEKKHTPF